MLVKLVRATKQLNKKKGERKFGDDENVDANERCGTEQTNHVSYSSSSSLNK
jgi:hypothetical protein